MTGLMKMVLTFNVLLALTEANKKSEQIFSWWLEPYLFCPLSHGLNNIVIDITLLEPSYQNLIGFQHSS